MAFLPSSPRKRGSITRPLGERYGEEIGPRFRRGDDEGREAIR